MVEPPGAAAVDSNARSHTDQHGSSPANDGVAAAAAPQPAHDTHTLSPPQ